MLNVSEYAKNTIHSDRRLVDMWVSFADHPELDLFWDDIKADSLSFKESICSDSDFKMGGVNISEVSFDFTIDSAVGKKDIDGYTFSPFLAIPLLDEDGKPIPYDSGTQTIVNNAIYIDYKFTMPAITVGTGGGFSVWKNSEMLYRQSGLKAGDTVRYRSFVRDVKPTDTIIINASYGGQYPVEEIPLTGAQQYELIPLGVYTVYSCSIESDSILRKLTGYDKLYSPLLDSELTYQPGEVVTMADLIDIAYEYMGEEFEAPYTLVDLAIESKSQPLETNTYSFTAPNGTRFDVVTCVTEVGLPASTNTGLRHDFNYVGLTDTDGSLTLLDSALSYFGLLQNKDQEAYASAYSSDNSSDIGYLRKNIGAILRPELNIQTGTMGKYITVTSLKYAVADGYRQTSFEAFEASVDKVLLDAYVPDAPEYLRNTVVGMHIDSYSGRYVVLNEDDSELEYHSVGRVSKAYIRTGKLVFTSSTNLNKRVFFDRWSDGLYDKLIEQFKAKNLCNEQGEFFERVDEESFDRALLVWKSAMSDALRPYRGPQGQEYAYDISFWDEWSWKSNTGAVNTSYAGYVENFPLELEIEGLGSFDITSGTAIDFTENYDPETGNIWMGPDAPLISVKEYRYTDSVIGLSFVAQDEVTFTPREALQAYAELQGKFFAMDRYGKPKFISIKDAGLYPEETLYPEEVGDAVFPEDSIFEEYNQSQAKKLTLYNVEPIAFRGLRIETVDGWQEPAYWGTGTKIYDLSNIVTLNFTIDDEDMLTIFQNIWESIRDVTLCNADVKLIGSPWIECGDRICMFNGEDSINMIVTDRTLSGISLMDDNFYQKFKK